ncbi:signal peptide peptidase A. Serine peptidase. MEROPS family S49 [Colwellia chukchiensis]|uniref:Signal peptide peptidase A. Serine peptidase. MEROPS family S49 n=1 Tax=Colwellia chukchiensis TaxID=641665 RepID=A0A1H7MUI5_9GAMM|nr:signal peptide peptidase SppA [Colwellia chukchiensis]SEL14950.1 signal peptide peptidase A. Serine peptidase. MEROPS family S49 [Colwellia chukchiensis]
MKENKTTFARISSGIFSVLNTTRKIIINLVFFVVAIIIIALNSDGDNILVQQNSALVLDIKGDIVEQKREIDPVDAFMSEAMAQPEQTTEVLLADILAVIEQARDDDRINTIVLDLKNLKGSGLTKLRDIAKQLTEFKQTGKKVIAIGESFNQNQYYLASFADEIWLNPKGWLLLDGYGRFQLYFKSALEKLSISQHVFRVGTYKSAVEPYIRDDMSAAAKEANQLWLNDLWHQYKTDVAAQRRFSTDNFDESIDALVAKLTAANGSIAEYALANNWVDALKTQYEMTLALNKHLDVSNWQDKKVTFNDYLTLINQEQPQNTAADKVAVIVAKGIILDGEQKAGNIGGSSTAKLLRKARENRAVKAVVLRVDSPGGSAYASDVIRQEVELLKAAGKPVIASMGSYAASGGYWISAAANKIYAAPSTITGSIGIFGFFMTFENTLSKLGIYTDGVGTTDISGFGVTRALSPGMAKLVQLNIERGYQDFLELVASNRNMSISQVDAIAQGRVWSGAKAVELGLVDALGDLDSAILAAANLANLDSYDTLLIEREKSPRALFLQSLFGQASLWFATPDDNTGYTDNSLSRVIAKLSLELNQLAQLNDPQGIYSFCLTCEIE